MAGECRGELTTTERKTLAQCERTIDKNKTAFLEVGNALRTIQEGKLYRATHPTFQAYVEARHDFKRAQAYRLIQQAVVHATLSSALDKPLENLPSRQAEALARLPEDQQVAAYQDACDRAEGTPSTADVEATVDLYMADNEPYEAQDGEEGEEAVEVESESEAPENEAQEPESPLASFWRGVRNNVLNWLSRFPGDRAALAARLENLAQVVRTN